MFGVTIREIRKSKSMTLKEAAGDTLSISQLSRFENGKSVIPVDLFYEILDNLNTTTEEFYFFMGQKKDRAILKTFDRIEAYVSKRDQVKLKQLKSELEAENPALYSWGQFLIYFIDSILNLYDSKEQNTAQPVLNYLMQVDDWGEMELRLYALFGFVFEVETTHFLMHTALKRSRKYLTVPAAARLLHTILSNNFSTFLFYGHIEYAEETITLFDTEYSENIDALTPHIDFTFNKGLLAFKKGDPDKGREYCEQAIAICNLFRQKESGNMYRNRYDTWKTEYNDPKFRELKVSVGFHDRMNGEE